MLLLLLSGSLILQFSFFTLLSRAFHHLLIWPQTPFLGLHVRKLQMWTPTGPCSIFSTDFQPTAGKSTQQEPIEQVSFMSHRYEYHFSPFKNLQAYLQPPVESLPIDLKYN